MRRVLIVDDHPVVLEGLRSLLAVAGFEVLGAVTDGGEALGVLHEVAPDVAVVDLNLKVGDGFGLLRHIRVQYPQVATVVYSMRAAGDVEARCLALGASAFVSKTAPVERLIAAIEQAVPRPFGHDEVADPLAQLSAREREVFTAIAAGASPGDVSRMLDIAPTTVSTHLRRLKDKLGVETIAELINYAQRL